MRIRPLRTRLTADQLFAIALAPLIFAILACLYIVVVTLQGRPFIYKSERMRSSQEAFNLFKIRTLYSSDAPGEQSALGGNLRHRITPIGAFLRRTRLDELPQIFNVLRGDIRFIGPRPPLRCHVAAYPEKFTELFSNGVPGITGLATVMLYAREGRLLARCESKEETDYIFFRYCIPAKHKIDMFYFRNKCISLDIYILWRTIFPSELELGNESIEVTELSKYVKELPVNLKRAA